MDADPAPAGGGSGTAPGFDIAAFKADILGDIRKDLNGIAKDLKKEIAKMSKPAEPPPPTDPITDPPQDPASPPATPKSTDPVVNSELAKQRREMSELKKSLETLTASNAAKDAALKESNRVNVFNAALNEISFKDAQSKSLFSKANIGDIVFDEDGQIVAKGVDGSFVTVQEYVKSQASLNPSLLAPQGGGGAGARSGSGVGSANGRVSLSKDLKPELISKMTPEQYAAVAQKVIAGEFME
jgi:hypothetical protein